MARDPKTTEARRHALTRRDLLRTSAAAAALYGGHAVAGPGMFLAPQKRDRGPQKGQLVVIYLRGGADFLNMVVPRGDGDYLAVRPTIGLKDEDGLLELDRDWGLSPTLGALKPLWDEGHLAPIVNVGSPHPTRSHFDAQDFMEFAAPGDRTQRNGWVNRYLTASTVAETGPDHYRAVAMQRLLPRSLRGDFPVLAMSPEFGGRADTAALDAFERFYGQGDGVDAEADPMTDPAEGMEMGDAGARDHAEVFDSGAVTIETMRRFQELLAGADADTASRHGYPSGGGGRRRSGGSSGGFAGGLLRIGQLFEAGAGLEIAGLDYNGWDHHTNQGGLDGTHARMSRDLADSLAAFCRHLGPRLETTTIVVMTEFGRTVAENGNRGTDHGHGGGMLLIGGGVRGGEVHGDWEGLAEADLYQGRDQHVTTDFRDVMAEVLRERMAFEVPKDFFGDHRVKKLKLYGK